MKVYLDNSASSRLSPRVLESMLPFLNEEFGNAQSVHSFGQRAKSAVERARRQTASLIGALPSEIVFLSGGTEADNLALIGVAEAERGRGMHIVTTAIEHPAVLATADYLEAQGYEITRLPVCSLGSVDPIAVRDAIRADTILVSVMHANNETGVIQPLEEISAVIKERRAATGGLVRFHTDAVQSLGKIPVHAGDLGVDLLSISAHKIHGPKGIGALYCRKGVRLSKLLHGGRHERDRRPGTENVPAIAGLGLACQMAATELQERHARMMGLRDYLENEVLRRIRLASINGSTGRRLPNISNMSFEGLDGESLLIALDLKGIAVSTGSACSSGSLEPSHVLTAMGLARSAVRGSLRFSLSAFTTQEEIDYAVQALCEITARLAEMAPDEPADAFEKRSL